MRIAFEKPMLNKAMTERLKGGVFLEKSWTFAASNNEKNSD